MGITVPGSMALSIRWELSSGLLRQGKLAGVWFPKKIPSVTAFSGQLGEFLLRCKEIKFIIRWVSVCHVCFGGLRKSPL